MAGFSACLKVGFLRLDKVADLHVIIQNCTLTQPREGPNLAVPRHDGALQIAARFDARPVPDPTTADSRVFLEIASGSDHGLPEETRVS